MHEIIIHTMDDERNTDLIRELKLPASWETIEEIMSGSGISQPYIPNDYSFRLACLNPMIKGTESIGELNELAERLSKLSEYERVILTGAVEITNCRSFEDCEQLMHNLDCFEVTPNADDYKTLGKRYAENDLTDTLKDIPPEILAHLDYEQLGRLKYDDGASAFVNGHRVRDTGQERREITPNTDPLSMECIKMRLCSDANPDGVWIKFPLVCGDEAPIDTPEQSTEMLVALAALHAGSLNECRAAECVCQYPGLNHCLSKHV
jgi:hypothetical protein